MKRKTVSKTKKKLVTREKKESGNRAQKAKRVVASIAFSALITLGLVEIGVRISGYLPRMEERIIISRAATIVLHPILMRIIEPDKQLFWRFKPNASVMGSKVTNRFGHRSPEIEQKKEKKRILAIGDSCTFGLQVGLQDSWPAQLQNKLDSVYGINSFEVINTGVPGYSSYQGLTVMKDAIPAFAPDIVVWGCGVNDSTSWAGVSDRFFASFFQLSPVEQPLAWSKTFLVARLFIKTLMVAPPITSQGELEGRLMGDYRPRLLPNEYEDNIREARQFCNTHGINMIILDFPMTCQVTPEASTKAMCALSEKYQSYQDIMHHVADETKTPIVDVGALFTKALPKKVLQDSTMHPSPAGYEIVAQALLEKIQMIGSAV